MSDVAVAAGKRELPDDKTLHDHGLDNDTDIWSASGGRSHPRAEDAAPELPLFWAKSGFALLSMLPGRLLPWLGKILVVLLEQPVAHTGVLFPAFMDPLIARVILRF